MRIFYPPGCPPAPPPFDRDAQLIDQHSQNLKWLLPEKGFAIAIYYSCGVKLTGTEIDLEVSEPDPTCAMILNWHL